MLEILILNRIYRLQKICYFIIIILFLDYPYPGSDTIGEDDTFWSPSMIMPPHSPPILQTQPHEIRSTPSTPGNKSRTSPPEAAVEATPETTPVKVCNLKIFNYFY